MENRYVANQHIATKLQRDRFVSPTWFDGIALTRKTKGADARLSGKIGQCGILFRSARLTPESHETSPPDAARTENRNVFEVLTPNQTVVPVAMTEIIVSSPRIRLRRIVPRSC